MTLLGIAASPLKKVMTLIGLEHPRGLEPAFWLLSLKKVPAVEFFVVKIEKVN